MDIIKLTNRQQLARYFQKDVYLHLYSLGDLDDFYWSRSTYYGIESKGEIDKVILLYEGVGDPISLALSRPGIIIKNMQDVSFLYCQIKSMHIST